MKNILKSVICFIAIITLYSCEGGTTFTKTISNTSSETLTVKAYTIYGKQNTVTIAPNEQKEIYWNDFMGRFVNDEYSCTNELDSIIINVSNDKTLMKDLLNSEFWIRESKDGRNSREDCYIVVSDADLE